MPPAANRHAYKIAMENGWYSRFDPALHDIVSCESDHPDAHVDIIRAFDRMKLGYDRGPETAETIAARGQGRKGIGGSVGFLKGKRKYGE